MFCQDLGTYVLKAPIDTVKLGQYSAVRFHYVDSLGNNTSITNELVIYKNGKEQLVIPTLASAVDNFCSYVSIECEDCFCCDINADGKQDFLISFFTGGANCCFGAYLYSIGDTLELEFEIDANLRQFTLTDLDDDHIPEFIYYDDLFAHWQDCYKCYFAPLIWRWDGEKYRLANYRYSEYILRDYDLSDLPCGDSWETIITLYYAGKSNIADSLFNACWPLNDPEKKAALQEFKKQYGYGRFVHQLQNSDW